MNVCWELKGTKGKLLFLRVLSLVTFVRTGLWLSSALTCYFDGSSCGNALGSELVMRVHSAIIISLRNGNA